MSDDRNEALRLAEILEGGSPQFNHEAAALLRQQAERIAELEKEALAKPFAPDWAGYRQGLEDGKREGQSERDQLRIDLDDELCNREVLDTMLTQCIAERDQLRAEVERLRADAERYRWLRDNFESEWAICEWQDDPDGLGYYRDARAPDVVDAALDHARTTHKDEG